MASLLVLDNPVFRSLLGYSAVILVKTMALSCLTTFFRITRKVWLCPEDASAFGAKQVVLNDPVVERIRRAHLNDLENVLPFVLLGLLYVSTGPSLTSALLHFRIFTLSRFIHTSAYLLALPQPTRALIYYVGFAVNASFAHTIFTQGAL